MPRYTIAGLLLLMFFVALELTAWRIEPLLAAMPLIPIAVLLVVLLVATIGRLISAVFSDRPTRGRDRIEH
ncbi:hypothetical protein [Aeoliella sp.]|uniref:hypothetical protein n=1 Tax=Aeoliella sp. TaxID=2795800 RepID=UPI003CCB7DF6